MKQWNETGLELSHIIGCFTKWSFWIDDKVCKDRAVSKYVDVKICRRPWQRTFYRNEEFDEGDLRIKAYSKTRYKSTEGFSRYKL